MEVWSLNVDTKSEKRTITIFFLRKAYLFGFVLKYLLAGNEYILLMFAVNPSLREEQVTRHANTYFLTMNIVISIIY